ncbi:MAG TPA: diaminopimelate epimerase [Kofleriaceae bacterium]|jgi:diaminopimelate epimerase|nr:diaminopimelate epimerase [Kofleriaceae bacterium]
MRFAKYHGLGNDFLVVDLRAAAPADAAAIQAPPSVIALCDRQFGVGGDGVLAILPSATADARMRVLNSDGSEAEMCGNGLRCVVKELYDRGGLARPTLAIETGAGRLVCDVDASGPGGGAVRMVTVAMGAPRLLCGEIPMTGPAGERCIEQPLAIAGTTRPVTCVSMGNPHAVTFVGARDEAMELARTVGPAVERHAWFPNRTNAEFAHVRDRREIDLVVWERGCGITLACGTGACATAVAAVVTGRADEATPIRVNLPGGSLEITVHPGLSAVAMKGPALHVFDGELDLARLQPRPA